MALSEVSGISGASLSYSAITAAGAESADAYVANLATPVGFGSAAAAALTSTTPPSTDSATVLSIADSGGSSAAVSITWTRIASPSDSERKRVLDGSVNEASGAKQTRTASDAIVQGSRPLTPRTALPRAARFTSPSTKFGARKERSSGRTPDRAGSSTPDDLLKKENKRLLADMEKLRASLNAEKRRSEAAANDKENTAHQLRKPRKHGICNTCAKRVPLKKSIKHRLRWDRRRMISRMLIEKSSICAQQLRNT